MTLLIHPFADIFPPLQGEAFAELVKDIRQHGLRDPIALFADQILDGRNRYNALKYLTETGEVLGDGWGHRKGGALAPDALDPPQVWFSVFNASVDGDPLEWVASKNLQRRHLTDDQRRMIGARLVSARQGRPSDQETSQVANIITRERAAEIVSSDVAGIDRARSVISRGVPEVVAAVDERKLSIAAAANIVRLPEAEQPAALERALPSGNRAIMASRVEPADRLDYFPTPPWATRALIEEVFPQLGVECRERDAWEPACGEGHIAEVLREYFRDVVASDIHEYGYGHVADYLAAVPGADWIITNPPFGQKTEAFVLKALDDSNVGVAMFVRLQWLETVGRYERLFRDRPPTLIAFFCERVPLCKGRWDPEGDTATAYIWLIWVKGRPPQPPFWIPPGRREQLTRDDDVERFTARPVTRKAHDSLAKEGVRAAHTEAGPPSIEPPSGRLPDGRTSDATETLSVANAGAAELPAAPAPIPEGDDPLDIPAFLKRASVVPPSNVIRLSEAP